MRWKDATVVLACSLLVALAVPPVSAQPQGDEWHPESKFEGKFDWVQMTSGEWLKGEIIVMYDESLEFDSDEFDEQTLDWGDIQQIRSSQVMDVGFVDKTTAVGILIVEGDKVLVVGDDGTREAHRDEVLSIIAGHPKEINFWSMKVFFGAIVRAGNTDVQEFNAQANFKRQTVRNRIAIDFVGNLNTTEDEKVSDNQRVSAGWDKFITKRFYATPIFAEYFRDPFQNIAARWTVGVGAGYQLIDSPKVDWDISGGPGYQENRFDAVEPSNPTKESTPALLFSTNADWDITSWMEFEGTYRFQLVNEESGKYNHHLLVSFETEITRLIDFDVSWIWDRIQEPQPRADGSVPDSDDFRTTVGLTFDF